MPAKFTIYAFSYSTGRFSRLSVANNSASLRPSGPVVVFGPSKMVDLAIWLILCKVHGKVLLKKAGATNNTTYSLPFYPLKLCESWKNQLSYHLEHLLHRGQVKSGSLPNITLLQMSSLRLPRYGDSLTQLVLSLHLDACPGCEAGTSTTKWYPIASLTSPNTTFSSPEPYLYLKSPQSGLHVGELSLSGQLALLNKQQRLSLVRSLGVTPEDLTVLYSAFLQAAYPSAGLSEQTFTLFLTQTGLHLSVNSKQANPTRRLFHSFCACAVDLTTPTSLPFSDLLLGLLALDRHTPHGGAAGELRSRAIFGYYACAQMTTPPSINVQELSALYRDIAATPKGAKLFDKTKPEAVVLELFKREARLAGEKEPKLTLERFLVLTGNLTIRGTASIYRSTHSPLSQLRTKLTPDPELLWWEEAPIERLPPYRPLPSSVPSSNPSHPPPGKVCSSCSPSTRPHHLALHSTLLDLSPTPSPSPLHIWELPASLTKSYPKHLRDASLEVLNATKPFNTLRETLRRFSATLFGFPNLPEPPTSGSGKHPKPSHPKWEDRSTRAQFVDQILGVCVQARETIRREARLPRLVSPLYIFGDLHGNLRDLMLYEHHLWRLAPAGPLGSALLLGDYVDRGEHSVEVALYLLVLKLLLGTKITLLRGNHEVRAVQKNFTFYRECLDKFGPGNGLMVWESLNQVFDVLPVAAVVDEKIFCAHGGIPSTVAHLSRLSLIPVPLRDPNSSKGGSKAAWEILWNDPLLGPVFSGPNALRNTFPIHPYGCSPNLKRGTAYYFTQDALDAFCELNDLSFLVRAHEVMTEGFQWGMEGKMVTVFSSSNYCGSGNGAAVVLVDGPKLRILKMETTKGV